MIVKKMPILQGFPDFETVKKLTKNHGFSEHFVPLFYDIETTGLSPNSTFLYLVGAVTYEENNWQMYEWMIENEEEEHELLKTFSGFLEKFSCTIQYNGDSFDQPYLEARYQIHGLPPPLKSLPSMDLYRELKPLKGLRPFTNESAFYRIISRASLNGFTVMEVHASAFINNSLPEKTGSRGSRYGTQPGRSSWPWENIFHAILSCSL